MRFSVRQNLAAAVLVAMLGIGCTSGGDPSGPTGMISLQVSPTGATVVQGGQTQVTGTLTRGGGFTGAVTFTVTGQPSGVTATAGTPQTSGDITTLGIAVQVGAGTAVGQYPITVRGTASGVSDAVATFQLTVAPAPDFSLAVAPATVSMVQGASRNDIGVTITRINFTGAVALALSGSVPAGVSATFAPPSPTGTTATMTLTVGASAAVGTHSVQISGTGAPGVRTTPFTLTITAAGSITLALTPAGGISLQQGTQDNSKSVTITRSNFPDPVTLTAEGLPLGVTAAFAGNPVTGNSAVMTLTAAAGATVGGPTTVTIRGSGPSGLQGGAASAGTVFQNSTTFQLTVTAAPPPGNVIVDFTGCIASQLPDKLFVQDGSGAWVRVTGTNDLYQFTINQATAGITRVLKGTSSASVNVMFLTRAELLAMQPYRFCTPDPVRRRVHLTIAGAGPEHFVNSSMRNWTNFSVGSGPITIDPTVGAGDFVGYRQSTGGIGSADRMLFLRDQNPPDEGSLGTVDFNAGTSFSTPAVTMNLLGTSGGETRAQSMNYFTRTSCDRAILYSGQVFAGTSFIAYGSLPVPVARASDFHELTVTTSMTGAERSVTESFHLLATRSLMLGPYMAAPTLSTLPAPYKRIQVQFVLPAEYRTSVSFQYNPTSPQRQVVLGASYAFLGGAGSTTLAMPDFSGVTGWDNADAPGLAQTGGWSVTATDVSAGGLSCTEGGRTLTTRRSGGPF